VVSQLNPTNADISPAFVTFFTKPLVLAAIPFQERCDRWKYSTFSGSATLVPVAFLVRAKKI